MEEISVITRKSGFQEDYKNFLASIGETPTVIIFTNDHNEIIYFEVVNGGVDLVEETLKDDPYLKVHGKCVLHSLAAKAFKIILTSE
jgi:hypothetical protein